MKTKMTFRGKCVIFLAAIILIAIVIMVRNHSKETTPVGTSNTPSAAVTTTMYVQTTSPVVTTTAVPIISSPSCSAAAIYCVEDKQLLYSDRIDSRVAPASLTKMLTASVALKYMNSSDVMTVGSEQYLVQPYSSLCGLQTGTSMTLSNLISGLMMASGNDAAYTIAVSVARNQQPAVEMSDTEAVSYFCDLMNKFALELGMTGSHFTTPDGWDDAFQYTTVSDLLILAEYVLNVPEIRQASGTYTKSVQAVTGEVYEWTDSNLLLDPYGSFYCPNAIGIKTGTTLQAGNCLVAAFSVNNKTYITAVCGCNSDSDRYDLTLKLFSSIPQ